MGWTLVPLDIFERRFDKFQKKHRAEATAVLNNVDSYFRALQEGANPINIKAGFIHHEPNGIKAIDQRVGKEALHKQGCISFPMKQARSSI